MPSPDDIMSISEIKPILRTVKGDGGGEISCALGLTESREGLILVSKKEKPRRVRANLLKKAKEVGLKINTQSVRFGRATTDPADDSVLLIKVNAGPTEGPLPLSIKKRTKSAGFKDVIFTVDPTLDQEPETDATPVTPSAPATPQPTASMQRTAPVDERQLNPDQLRGAMEKLAPGIKSAMGASVEMRKQLMAASTAFVQLLQASDLEGARHSLEDIIRLLKQAAMVAGPRPGTAELKKVRAAWQDAIGTVDVQIEKLADSLRRTENPELDEIAEFGLSSVTGGHKVPLMAALAETEPGTPQALETAVPKALAALRAFRKHIDSDERVAACDGNPFGVSVSIRSTLGPALTELETALTATAQK